MLGCTELVRYIFSSFTMLCHASGACSCASYQARPPQLLPGQGFTCCVVTVFAPQPFFSKPWQRVRFPRPSVSRPRSSDDTLLALRSCRGTSPKRPCMVVASYLTRHWLPPGGCPLRPRLRYQGCWPSCFSHSLGGLEFCRDGSSSTTLLSGSTCSTWPAAPSASLPSPSKSCAT